MKQLFSLGKVQITRKARAALDEDFVKKAIDRHAQGDWGEISKGDCNENDSDLHFRFPSPLHSSYTDQNDVVFWIVTSSDRSTTTIFLHEECQT